MRFVERPTTDIKKINEKLKLASALNGTLQREKKELLLYCASSGALQPLTETTTYNLTYGGAEV
jgi:hypothetical protein